MSNPILPSAILTDFVAAIKAIVPAETGLSSARFTFVRSREQAEGAGLRTFTLEIEQTGDGPLTGCGNDFVFTLNVITSYRGLQRFDAQCMIAEDNRQLWQTLALRSGSLDGLQEVLWTAPGFEYEDQTDVAIWRSHVFSVRYISGNSP